MNTENLCNDLKFSSSISAISSFIASKFDDPDEIELIGTIFTQIGDTLSAIAARRIVCDKRKDENKK